MSIFGSIVSAIFGRGQAAATSSATNTTTPAGSATAATPGAGKATPMTRAQVEEMIQNLANESGQTYNWKQSIVDLMKLLDLDSSLKARQELARELGYTGALNGSAEMNIWLHQQVMTRLMEGKDIPQA